MWLENSIVQHIISDQLTVVASVDELMLEVNNNTWSISMSDAERQNTTSDDLLAFFESVIENRTEQLRQSNVKQGMYFYLWHDRQASQLRFSLISDFHPKLPFSSPIQKSEPKAIIHSFLISRNGVAWSDLDVQDVTQEKSPEIEDNEYVLPVYVKHLIRSM